MSNNLIAEKINTIYYNRKKINSSMEEFEKLFPNFESIGLIEFHSLLNISKDERFEQKQSVILKYFLENFEKLPFDEKFYIIKIFLEDFLGNFLYSAGFFENFNKDSLKTINIYSKYITKNILTYMFLICSNSVVAYKEKSLECLQIIMNICIESNKSNEKEFFSEIKNIYQNKIMFNEENFNMIKTLIDKYFN